MINFLPQDAMGVVETANGCGDHPSDVQVNIEDIDVVLYYNYGCSCGEWLAAEETKQKKLEEELKRQPGAVGLDDHDDFARGNICGGMCDTWSTTAFRLKNGKYVIASEHSDTTGHGCQCGGSVEIFETKEEFLKLGIEENSEIRRYIR